MTQNIARIILNLLILAVCLAYITATLHITVIQALLIWLSIGFATGSVENIIKILWENSKNYGKNQEK